MHSYRNASGVHLSVKLNCVILRAAACICTYLIYHFLTFCRDKKEIQNSIKAQKERNAILLRINSELNQELQEMMEQRISLEIQLEHIKPC